MKSGATTVDTECPVCSGSIFTTGEEAFDDRYGHPGLFKIVRCHGCGHLMTSPQLQESDLPALYGTYYPRKSLTAAMVAKQSQGAASWSRKVARWFSGTDNQGQYTVRAGERMLAIGCGGGLSLLEAHLLGAQAWGVEADPNVQPLARELGLQVHQGNLQDKPFPDVQFDLVVMNQVIEHIPQPDLVLAEIHTRLAPNGRVVLVFPNVNSLWCKLSGMRWINWHIPYHLHHFSRQSFSRLAQRCGYRITAQRTITPNLWTLLQVRASRNVAVQGQPSALWATGATADVNTPPASVSWGQRMRRTVLFMVLVPVGVFNRLVDAFGWGDSLLVELVPVKSS